MLLSDTIDGTWGPGIGHFPAPSPSGPAPAGKGRSGLNRPNRIPAPLSPPALAVMVEGLARAVDADALPLSPGLARRYSKLLATEQYEVWLIAWGVTGAVDLHDHGGSLGVVRVVRGALVESSTDLDARHPLRSSIIGPGQTVHVPASCVHEVWNPGPAPALSLHVYSPPLAAMTFFDPRPEHFLQPLRTEYEDLVV